MKIRSHTLELRSRYCETDQMGIVHHSIHYQWFEAARSELCRAWGVPYQTWEEQGVALPVVESRCRYRRPLLYDRLYRVTVRLKHLQRHKLTFDYLIIDEEGQTCAEGMTVHAVAGMDGKLLRAANPFWEELFIELAAASLS